MFLIVVLFVSKLLSNNTYTKLDKLPLPSDLQEKLKIASVPIMELSTGFAITQFKTNTPAAISIGENNIYPSVYFDGTAWFMGYFGISANYTRSIIIARGINANPNFSNSVIMGPEFFNYMLKARLLFSYLSWSSYIALRLGKYYHNFNLDIPSAYIHKTHGEGWNLGVEYRMALGAKSSFFIYTDFIKLDSFVDNSIIDSAQNGLGYRLGAKFSFTLVENDTNKTLLTLGYSFTTHIADLKSDTFNSRDMFGVKYFEETFDNLYISFTTWF